MSDGLVGVSMLLAFAGSSAFAMGPLARGQATRVEEVSAPRGVSTWMQFVDASEESGLIYSQVHGPSPKYPNMLGGGTVGDFNNDGYMDVFALGNGGVADGFFLNNGDGTFSDHAGSWGIAQFHYAFGASSADFNNDGFLDLFITSYGDIAGGGLRPGQLKLYRNNGPDENGQWSFTDVAVDAGVNFVHPSTTDGTGSAWGDIDLDGDLDLFVGGYNANRQVNRLYRNDGPDSGGVWRFTDITLDAGLVHEHWSVFVPGIQDLNGDGYPELLAISDHGSSVLWMNNGDNTFTNRNDLARPIEMLNGMGLDFGDINRDGLLDFYATSIVFNATELGNQLLIQQPDGRFLDVAHEVGVWAGYWGWGAVMADLDHDRDLDIVEANGFENGDLSSPAVLFENNGDASGFVEVAEECGLVHRLQGRGVVKFDSDNDGDLDIVIFTKNGPLKYYRNDLLTLSVPMLADRHWVRVVLDTRASDRLAPQGVGSTVFVRAGGEEYMLPVHSGSNHCSSSPIEVHAGLGGSAGIDAVRVAWADGSFTTMTDLDADQILRISAPAFPADIDGSGLVDMNDVGEYVSRFIQGDLSADTTGDWMLDIFDVFVFIGDYRDATGT
ncbi:MAG: CRTAC1 family protein [Phycisphaerales bacterium]|nr:CRTAC1 family protein [Phycisphaerales bacterium]